MGTQMKRSTSLDAERQEQLAEILEAEPLANVSVVLALGLDAIHALWRKAGNDMKGAVRLIGALRAPEGAA